jgi:hypothetical protein
MTMTAAMTMTALMTMTGADDDAPSTALASLSTRATATR